MGKVDVPAMVGLLNLNEKEELVLGLLQEFDKPALGRILDSGRNYWKKRREIENLEASFTLKEMDLVTATGDKVEGLGVGMILEMRRTKAIVKFDTHPSNWIIPMHCLKKYVKESKDDSDA